MRDAHSYPFPQSHYYTNWFASSIKVGNTIMPEHCFDDNLLEFFHLLHDVYMKDNVEKFQDLITVTSKSMLS